MTWEVVDVRRGTSARSVPKARVGRGSISLNSAAIDLLGRAAGRGFAELMFDYEDGRVGIRFLEERTDRALPVRRKTSKGKRCAGLTISSKAHMRELFGEAGNANGSVYYSVGLDPDERNVLVLTQ